MLGAGWRVQNGGGQRIEGVRSAGQADGIVEPFQGCGVWQNEVRLLGRFIHERGERDQRANLGQRLPEKPVLGKAVGGVRLVNHEDVDRVGGAFCGSVQKGVNTVAGQRGLNRLLQIQPLSGKRLPGGGVHGEAGQRGKRNRGRQGDGPVGFEIPLQSVQRNEDEVVIEVAGQPSLASTPDHDGVARVGEFLGQGSDFSLIHSRPLRHRFGGAVGCQNQISKAFTGPPLSVRPIIEAEHVILHKLTVVKVFLDQHVRDAQRQGRFRSRRHRQPLIGFGGGERAAGFDLHDLGRPLVIVALAPQAVNSLHSTGSPPSFEEVRAEAQNE